MESTKQVLVVKQQEPEAATQKQVIYVERLAKHLGFFVNTKNMTKQAAAEKIEQFKKIIEGEKKRKIKENEVKLAMVKKLIYKMKGGKEQMRTPKEAKPKREAQPVIQERVINLELINDKLNYIINQLDPIVALAQKEMGARPQVEEDEDYDEL